MSETVSIITKALRLKYQCFNILYCLLTLFTE